MGSNSVLNDIAAASKSTLEGAKSISKAGINMGKTHYNKSRKDKSSGEPDVTTPYETSARLEQLPDPKNFPPPPLRAGQKQYQQGGMITENTIRTVDTTRQRNEFPQPNLRTEDLSRPIQNAGRELPKTPAIQNAAKELPNTPLNSLQYTSVQPVVRAALQNIVVAPTQNGDMTATIPVSEQAPPAIPARNYSPSVIQGSVPNIPRPVSRDVPEMPARSSNTPVRKEVRSSTPSVIVKPFDLNSTKAERDAMKGIAINKIDISKLPPPPTYIGKRFSEIQNDSGIRTVSTPNIPTLTSTENFSRDNFVSAKKPPSPPPRSPSLSHADVEIATPANTLLSRTSSSGLKPSPISLSKFDGESQKSKSIASVSPSVLGKYNYDVQVGFEPPPKPFRKSGSQNVTTAKLGPTDMLSASPQSHRNSSDSRKAPMTASLYQPADPPPYSTVISNLQTLSINGRNYNEQPAPTKKQAPIVPKKKDSLAGVKKERPPVPKKKPTLQSIPQPGRSDSRAEGTHGSSQASNGDDNPFRRYLENVVPKENDRIHR